MNNRHFSRRYCWIAGLVVMGAVAGSLWGISQLQVEVNMHAFIPSTLQEKISLFESSALNRKMIAVVQTSHEDDTLSLAQELQEELQNSQLISPPFTPTAQWAFSLVDALPARFTETDEQQLRARLTPQAMAEQLKRGLQRLLSVEGFLYKPLFEKDPLDGIALVTQKLAALNPQSSARYQEGWLTSADGKIAVGMYDLIPPTDGKTAQQLEEIYTRFSTQLPVGSQVFFLGALRYNLENMHIIQRDIVHVSLCGCLGLALIFACLIRRKVALLMYVVPLVVLPLAAIVTYGVFGSISGITLGFGSVVAGLAVDYAVYLFFALQGGGLQARSEINKHLFYTFTTSALCFAALFCSSVELFRQLAVFSISGLFFSLLLAWFVLPVCWQHVGPAMDTNTALTPRRVRYLTRKQAGWLSGALILFGVWGLVNMRFSGDIEGLNATSPLFKKQKQVFEEVFSAGHKTPTLLFVKADTLDEALLNNERVAEKLGLELAVSSLFPSSVRRQENMTRWQRFWQRELPVFKPQFLQLTQQMGFQTQAFDSFFASLTQRPQTEIDFSLLYDPVVSLETGEVAVVNILPAQVDLTPILDDEHVVVVSNKVLREELLHTMKKEAWQIVCLAVLFNLAAVGLLFKSIYKALLAVAALVLAACFTFGCLALLQIEVNFFLLVFLPLLMGLGIDYSIFQLSRVQSQQIGLYPPKALWVAALSTLAGFGVLILAKHPVLFLMGISSFLAVGGALMSALFILPAWVEEDGCEG